MRTGRPASLLLLPLLLSFPVASALAQYRAEQFTTNNGLPQNTISGIAQTPDGYLWIATYDGLARYDGVTFTLFDRGTTPEMPRTLFLSLTVDGSGALWAGTAAGILRYTADTFQWFEPIVNADGTRHPAQASAQPAFVPAKPPRWRIENGALITTDSLRTAPTRFSLPVPNLQLAGEDRTGNVWLFNGSSLVRFSHGVFTTVPSDSLIGSRSIRVGFVDRDGTLWVGTNERGLFRVTRQFLKTYTKEDGIFERIVYPVLEDQHGRVWIGSGLGVTRWDHGQFTSFAVFRTPDGGYRFTPTPPGSAGANADGLTVRAMYADREGRVWLSVANATVAIEHDAITHVHRLPDATADVILEDHAGDLWVGAGTGLTRFHGDSARTYTSADGLPTRTNTTALAEDAKGTLWVGLRAGLARLSGDKFVTYTSRDGLSGNYVRSMYVDADGTLWVGTFDNGLTRYRNGRFTSITTRNGLFCSGVFAILEDADAQFWMSCNRGIFRVSRQQLNAFADGKSPSVISVAYGARDGMRSSEANGGRQPAGAQAQDGTLWFPTQDGVVVIDPAALDVNMQPPLTVFNRLEVDGTSRPLVGAVRLAPGESNLEIGYTAPGSLYAEYVHFRYKLTSLDAGWIEAGTTRQVHYSHLPPGHYTFNVIAANSDGIWGRVPATIAIVVDPHFYQTTWFFTTLTLTLGTLVVGGYTLRVRGLKAQERRLTQLVADRTADLQIANERLHHLATEDGLTGLANHRRFEEFLVQEWRRAVRAKAPVSLLLMDVDHFKLYNDTYGHPAGDECLRRVAAVLAAHIRRGTDLAARYGGEEFAIVLTDTTAEGAGIVAEKVRAGVAELQLPHSASSVAPFVTVSVGIASVTASETGSPDELVAAADQALYRAKEGGRNRLG